jgi:sugar phosphate isomerase/epimerase
MNALFAPATRLLWHAGVIGALEGAASAGFQASEVWSQHITDTQVNPQSVLKRARDLGLALSLHAPNYDLNPLSSNPEIRSVSRKQVMNAIELAATLQAKVVVVHPGALSSTTDDVEDYWRRLEDYAVQLDAKAASLGLRIAIEAMEKKKLQFVTTISSLQRLAGLLETVQANHVGLALDVAHAGTMGDPMEFLAQVPRVIHAHLSDTSDEKTHALLGEGRLDLPTILPALLQKLEGQPGLIAIEGRLSSDEPRAVRVAAAYLERF